MAPLYLMLKDYAIDLEIQREFYRDVVILTSSSDNPDKFTVLDKIQKLYNQKFKTSVERLVEGYKKEFGDGKSKEVKIRIRDTSKIKISEMVKNLPQK
jgi:predicted metal-dependent hydrolase